MLFKPYLKLQLGITELKEDLYRRSQDRSGGGEGVDTQKGTHHVHGSE